MAAREAEAGMEGRTHNLLNQSVAAGYRSNGINSRQGPNAGKDQDGTGSKSEKKRSKRPRPGGPPGSPRGAPSGGGAGGASGAGGGAAAAGLVVERPSARYYIFGCNVGCHGGIWDAEQFLRDSDGARQNGLRQPSGCPP